MYLIITDLWRLSKNICGSNYKK